MKFRYVFVVYSLLETIKKNKNYLFHWRLKQMKQVS